MKSLAELAELKERADRSAAFTCIAKSVMMDGGPGSTPADIAGRNPRAPRAALEALQKAEAPGGGLDDENWTAINLQGVTSAFLASLIGVSAFDTLLNGGALRLPLRTRVISTLTVPEGANSAEAAAKPVTGINLGATGLERRNATSLLTVTEEILTAAGSAGEAYLAAELRRAITRSTDSAFINLLIADGSPSPPLSSQGSFEEDAQAAVAALDIGSGSRIYMIAPTKQVTSVELAMALHGAASGPVTLLASDSVPAGAAVAVAADGIAMGSEAVTFRQARHASIDISATPAPQPQNLVSLWQTNSRGLMLERYWGAAIARAGAVTAIENINWPTAGLYASS